MGADKRKLILNGKNIENYNEKAKAIGVETLPYIVIIIDELAEQMATRPKLKIEIQGHTDNIGKIEINQTLSEQRANAVKDALVQRGIESSRIRTRGFGMTMPVVPNDTEENRAKNRRTQFVILAK